MMLELDSFADPANHEKERLVIKVLSDLDIGNYLILWSNVSETKSATAGRKTAYWFPDGTVKSGDLVILYTKSGQNSKKDLTEGHTAHFYYWGLENALWGAGVKTAVIMKIEEWFHRIS